MTGAARDNEQVPDTVAPRVPVIENKEEDTARVKDTAGNQPGHARGRERIDE